MLKFIQSGLCVFLKLQKSSNPTRFRYPNPLDELETSTVKCFSASLTTFVATILESKSAPALTSRLLI